MNKQYNVYWYHLIAETNKLTDGYIGVTSNLHVRHRTHLYYSNGYAPRLREAFLEYGEKAIVKEIIFTGTKEEALALERELRPSFGIGWNMSAGGGNTPDCTGIVHTKESRLQRSISVRAAMKGKSYPSVFKGRTDRHTVEQKAHIGSFHKGKSITNAHKKCISEKLSGGKSPVAKSITLYHKSNPTVPRTFDCIKTASTELGIGYSALRSLWRSGSTNYNRMGWAIAR